jgi:hypothetical protein
MRTETDTAESDLGSGNTGLSAIRLTLVHRALPSVPADFGGTADIDLSACELQVDSTDTASTCPNSAGTGPAEASPIEAVLAKPCPAGLDSDIVTAVALQVARQTRA